MDVTRVEVVVVVGWCHRAARNEGHGGTEPEDHRRAQVEPQRQRRRGDVVGGRRLGKGQSFTRRETRGAPSGGRRRDARDRRRRRRTCNTDEVQRSNAARRAAYPRGSDRSRRREDAVQPRRVYSSTVSSGGRRRAEDTAARTRKVPAALSEFIVQRSIRSPPAVHHVAHHKASKTKSEEGDHLTQRERAAT